MMTFAVLRNRNSVGCLLGLAVLAASADAQPPKKRPGQASTLMANLRPSAKLPGKVDQIKAYADSKERQNLKLINASALGRPLTVDQLNQVIGAELESANAKAGARITDEQFVRRAYLNVIGQLPAPADIEDFAADKSEDRKAKVVDRLLSLPQFGENFARYWHDAISYRNTGGKNREIPFQIENWFAEQFNQNVGWDRIVTAMITAAGPAEETPQGMLIAAHDAMPAELTGETARLFLGLQISCAQCHDHPNDHWKRDQFHELAAFFGGVALRRQPGQTNPLAFSIGEKPRFRGGSEYRKPNLKDPSDPGTLVTPVFLSGQPLPAGLNDADRRKALAEFVTTKRNPLFAKAFVNRVWAEFMGAPFTHAVDDLGDKQDVVLPKTFDALAKSFAASNYDVKKLVRMVVLSDAYDRQFAESSSSEKSEGAVAPSRLASAQIIDALDWVLGGLNEGRRATYQRPNAPAAARRPMAFASMMENAFGFDPSVDATAVEGSIPQALAMMNNRQINAKISADRSANILAKILKANPKDDDAVRALYLRVLARKPTEAEVQQAKTYLSAVGRRQEAFEDLLWALLNTTEFLHNH